MYIIFLAYITMALDHLTIAGFKYTLVLVTLELGEGGRIPIAQASASCCSIWGKPT